MFLPPLSFDCYMFGSPIQGDQFERDAVFFMDATFDISYSFVIESFFGLH